MARAVRPGGRIVLEDDDHDILRLWPEPAGLTPLWRAYIRSFDRLGNDPGGRRPRGFPLHAAGAPPGGENLVFFWGCFRPARFPGPFADARRALLGTGEPNT